MSDYAKHLLEQRANRWEQAKGLLDTAASEKRELTGEEEQSYSRLTAEIEDLRSKADKLVEDQKNAEAAEAALRSIAKPAPGFQAAPQNDVEAQLRSFLRGESRSFALAPTVDEKRALSKGTATAGGNTVPTSFYPQLWEHLIETATLINGGATVFNTDSGENFEVPVTTSHGAAAAVSEGGTIAGTDPAFAKRTLGAYKFGELIVASREIVEDTGVDLLSYLARIAGWNLGNAFGQKLITGTGSSEPTGITASTTLGVTGGTGVAGVPTLDNLIDLLYSVTAPYRNRPTAKWVIKDSTAASLRKIKDTTNNYIWQPAVVAGQPDSLLGKPILTDPYMPATGTTAKSVIFGDLSSYAVRVVNGIRFERSDDVRFDSDQVTFRAVIRGDGLLLDQTGAVKHYIGAAS